MPVKISVQICSYNRKDLLRRSLEAVSQVDFPAGDFEIVLVDDGSTDGTDEMVKEMNTPCAVKFFRQEHKGLAAGRNVGIRNAEGEVILIIDDDCIADKHLLEEHWKTHQQHQRCVVAGWVNHIEDLEKANHPRFRLADISTSFFWTSNVSVRKRYLEEVGLFDEECPGWEDMELGHRLKKLGLVKVYNGKAIVFHYKPRPKAVDLPRMLRYAEVQGRSAAIYFQKRPRLTARLSTGIFPARFMWNDFLSKRSGFFQRMVDGAGDKPLRGLAMYGARTLMSFEYFKGVREVLEPKDVKSA